MSHENRVKVRDHLVEVRGDQRFLTVSSIHANDPKVVRPFRQADAVSNEPPGEAHEQPASSPASLSLMYNPCA